MKRKNYTPLYAVLQALVWGGFGIVISYSEPYFKAAGLTDGQYGLIMGLVSALAFFVMLGLAELCSRLPRLTLQRLVAIMGALTLVCSIVLCLLPLSAWLLLTLFCLMAISVQALPSLVNGLGMAGLGSGLDVNFGVARGIGSASFAVFSFLAGQLIPAPQIGVKAVPMLYAVVSAALIVFALLFPKVRTAAQEKPSSGTPLLKNLSFLMVLLGSTLLYVSHNFLCNFFTLVATARGGNEANQGVCLAIAAFCELPVMFLFVKMLKIGRCDVWLKLSGVFMALRVFGCFLAPNVSWLYAVQFFQLLGFALFSVASVFYIGSVVDETDTVRAQAMLASTCTLSNVVTFLLGGTLLDRFGVDTVLILSTLCAAAGTLILIVFAKKPRHSIGVGTEETEDDKENA